MSDEESDTTARAEYERLREMIARLDYQTRTFEASGHELELNIGVYVAGQITKFKNALRAERTPRPPSQPQSRPGPAQGEA